MAMPVVTATDWTVEMLDALPEDGQRREIIDGELFVTPAPGDVHQYVVVELCALFHAYLRGGSTGKVVVAPADVEFADPRKNRLQPDVFVVRLVDGVPPTYPFAMTDVLVSIEVVSPGNPRYDYQTKRALYLAHGVPEYWVVNPDARNISRWCRSGDPGEVLHRIISWHPAGMAVPLVIDIAAVFEAAQGSGR